MSDMKILIMDKVVLSSMNYRNVHRQNCRVDGHHGPSRTPFYGATNDTHSSKEA